ncbi:MAG: HAD family hydrolase [Clostridiales bacterium]|nr:HAD family hydrolase [Clostridiales bacterium]
MNKTVIFDMDGTLFDTERLVLDCWMKTAEEIPKQQIEEVFRKCIGTTGIRTKEIFQAELGAQYSYDDFLKRQHEAFVEATKEKGMPVKKGAQELLSYLKDNGWDIGLASSTRYALVVEELTQTNLVQYFRVLVGGDMAKRSKPEPDIYLLACEKMGVDPVETFAVEDSYHGVRSSSAAGMKVIMVPDLQPAQEEMERLSFAILPDLLKVKDFFADLTEK